MAGQKNQGIRRLLRVWLLTDDARELSDTKAAAEVGCHRLIVTEVRRQLIAAGKLPARPEYKAGGAARGGYVWDARGRMVRADSPSAYAGHPKGLTPREAKQLRELLSKVHEPNPTRTALRSRPRRTPGPASP